jgi:SNF2 family DNA or RNA helicase
VIKEITLPPDYKVHLALFFCPQNTASYQSNQQMNQQRLIINQFFDYSRTDTPEVLDIQERRAEIPLVEFYDKLREAHVTEERTDEVTIDTTHLKPVLRKYQESGIKWMLRRETKPSYLPTEFVEATALTVPDVKFYLNLRTLELTDRYVGDIHIPAGGILCDEMGLGKTVEMLALILNNPMDVANSQGIMFDDTPIIGNYLVICY